MKKTFKLARFGTALLALIFVSVNTLFAAPTEQSFRNDMAYYRKISKNKNLNANDRLYILDRFRKKYKNAQFDLSELFKEINYWYQIKAKEPKGQKKTKKKTVQRKPTPKATSSYSGGRLIKALVTEGSNYSRLILQAPNTEDIKHDLVEDDSGTQPPVIVIYLYDTKEALKPFAKNFSIKNGLIRQVQSQLVANNPPTTKVSVSLRDYVSYKVSKVGNQYLITVRKSDRPTTPTVPETATPLPAPVPVAPQGLQAQRFDPTPLPPVGEADPVPKTLPQLTQTAQIETGDILNIQISGPVELNHQAVVRSDGKILMPILGEIQSKNVEVTKLEALMEKKLSKYVANPRVKISTKKFASKQVFLTGQVRAPGVYKIDGPLMCYELISRSGGFLDDADLKKVTVYSLRGGQRTMRVFDIDQFLNNGDMTLDVALLPGDVIEVPQSQNYVFITGAVKTQGRYKYEKGMNLMQTIYTAGGFEGAARLDRVRIVRGQGKKKVSRDVNVSRILKRNPNAVIDLEPGDLIIVPQKTDIQEKIVTHRVIPWATFFVSLALVLALLV